MFGKKSKYSRAQKNAYHSGRGYRVAHEGRGIDFKKPEVREAFQAGYRAAGDTMKKNPSKYQPLKSKKKIKHSSPSYKQPKIDVLGDFEYDHRGRIKGAYTPDGIFEPD